MGRWSEQLDLWGDMDNVLRFDPFTGAVDPLFSKPSTVFGGAASQVVPSPDGTELLVDGEVIDFLTDRQRSLRSAKETIPTRRRHAGKQAGPRL